MTGPVLHIDTATEWRGGQRQLELLLAGRPGDLWAGVASSPLAERVGPPLLALRPGAHPLNVLALCSLRGRFSLVAAHTPHALGAALLAGLPTVAHRRVDFAPSPLKYRRAKHVIAVSEAVRAVLVGVGVPRDRISVVYDGIELPSQRAAPAPRWTALPRPLYGCVGALVAHKGHRVAVDAMATTPGTLVIAGEGALRSALERQIAERDLGGRVLLVGHVSNVSALLTALDGFVHPSLEEGMGQAVVEAMWAGCRIVTAATGGIPEVLGDTGLMVPPNDPAALSAAMKQVLQVASGRGCERAALFSVTAMIEGTSQIYEQLRNGVSPPT